MTALDFSVGTDIGRAYQRMPQWLPFGCHAWNKQDYCFWKPMIETYGYRLPEPQGRQAVHWRQRRLDGYVTQRVLRDCSNSRYAAMLARLEDFLPSKGRPIALWGAGQYGRVAMNLLAALGRNPVVVFDRNAMAGKDFEHVKMLLPNYDMIRQQHLFVIIATTSHAEEI